MDAQIHGTSTRVCMFTNYQQTQSQWPQSRGPVTKLAFQCNAIDRQSTQYPKHRVLQFYLLGKIEICPTAQKIHDNKLHSSHLPVNQMINTAFWQWFQKSLILSSLVLHSDLVNEHYSLTLWCL